MEEGASGSKIDNFRTTTTNAGLLGFRWLNDYWQTLS